ncbi:SGNH/GDSL hydrolase family protein [Polaribacter aestuariivivens]|uniref:SGNH/GDSL hydrolase family protein n=1 Tax=Polaribacter aestuariivivens TaxID=2304626 RepID=UPI003F494A68
MKKEFHIVLYILFFTIFSCGSVTNFEEDLDINSSDIEVDTTFINPNNGGVNNNGVFKILSLGDSYTIGESVCETCKFPVQLVDTLLTITQNKSSFPLKIIAKTGWTTTNLISAIDAENINSDYNLVTLLIGVNNQYQRKPFSTYETEFPKLVEIATKATNNNIENLIVISIPDYAFTPFGRANTTISSEIDTYNNFAQAYCNSRGITFINITGITRQGLVNPALVANDGLHPSKLAYKKFVERITPIVLQKLNLN